MEDNNYSEKASVKQVSIKWGLILGVISIALFLITIFGGLVGNKVMQWLTYIPMIIIIVLAHKEYKNEGDGFMSYGQGLGIGTLTVFIGSLLSTIFFYIYVKFVDAGFIETIKDQQIVELEKGGMSDEQIEQAMSISESFMTPEMMSVFAILGSVFFGFILSLIISAFTKNSNPELDV